MEIDVFLALKSAGIPDTEARAAVEAIRKDSTQIRDAQKDMATKSDLKDMATKNDLSLLKAELKTDMANLKSEISAQLLNMQRSTVATMFGGCGMITGVMALLQYLR